MAASDVVLRDAEGNVVEGKHEVETSAFCIHSRVHLNKPSAMAALHTHMPCATTLAHVAGGRLQMGGQTALMFDGRIAYDDTFKGPALDSAEGDRMASALGDADILFLAGHGALVTGPSVAAALTDLIYLERACMFQVLAHSHGGGLLEVSGEVRECLRGRRPCPTCAMDSSTRSSACWPGKSPSTRNSPWPPPLDSIMKVPA